MNDIAIYGAGGLGRETALLIDQINAKHPTWNTVGFFDDALEAGCSIGSQYVLGGIEEALRFNGSMILAMADPGVRREVHKKLEPASLDYPVIVHPSCILGDGSTNKLGQGSILTAGVILTTHITLGCFSIINLSTTIGHDAVLGDYVTVMPGCSISGAVKVGTGTWIGVGARLLQHIEMGEHCIVGAGAVVTRSFSIMSKVMGVPARCYGMNNTIREQ